MSEDKALLEVPKAFLAFRCCPRVGIYSKLRKKALERFFLWMNL